jgi:uncharacterized protein YcgL (UPF0745 family)
MLNLKTSTEDTKEVCRRCNTEVLYTDVSEGYYAQCPEHDEDLFKFEVV